MALPATPDPTTSKRFSLDIACCANCCDTPHAALDDDDRVVVVHVEADLLVVVVVVLVCDDDDCLIVENLLRVVVGTQSSVCPSPLRTNEGSRTANADPTSAEAEDDEVTALLADDEDDDNDFNIFAFCNKRGWIILLIFCFVLHPSKKFLLFDSPLVHKLCQQLATLFDFLVLKKDGQGKTT